MSNKLFPFARAFVHDLLKDPLRRYWTVQGFGMLRCYFGESNEFRLNIWHSHFRVPNVSTIHDHPWHFDSWIVAGYMQNVRFSVGTIFYPPYKVSTFHPNYHVMKIMPGDKGGPAGEVGSVRLIPQQPEVYTTGDHYSQQAHEIHETFYANGTVTLNARERVGDDLAQVFWPIDTNWVDAKPRHANVNEILIACYDALKMWDTIR